MGKKGINKIEPYLFILPTVILLIFILGIPLVNRILYRGLLNGILLAIFSIW